MQSMSDLALPSTSAPSAALLLRVREVRQRFEAAWQAAVSEADGPILERYLGETEEPERSLLLHALLSLEVAFRRLHGDLPTEATYYQRFPDHRGVVRQAFLRNESEGLATRTEVAQSNSPILSVGVGPRLNAALPLSSAAPDEGARLHEQETVPPPPPGPAAEAATLPPSADSPGLARGEPSRIAGYEILGELGQGAMGVVYKARQVGLNRLVALKMIRAGEFAGPAERQRFQAEAEAVARLKHPGIVQIYEIGEHQGLPFFSLEFCPGGSLAAKHGGTPVLPKEAAQMVATLARAMQAAHAAGIIHRDLKPANVLVAEDGALKVTDFGLAKQLDQAGQTASGAVMGTPSYMAPEQAAGQSKAIGPAADVYALGAILYELLTGRPPFRAATVVDTLMQVVADEPVRPRRWVATLPRDLETVCLKCLSKAAANRYASAQDLADDLERWLAGEPVRARPLAPWQRVDRWLRRLPRVADLGLAILLCGTAVAVALAASWHLAAGALAIGLAGYVAVQTGPRAVGLGAVGSALTTLAVAMAWDRAADISTDAALLVVAAPSLLAAMASAWRRSRWLVRAILLVVVAGFVSMAAGSRDVVVGLPVVAVGAFLLCGYVRVVGSYFAAPYMAVAFGLLGGGLLGWFTATIVLCGFAPLLGVQGQWALPVLVGFAVAGGLLGAVGGAARRRGARTEFGVYVNPGTGPVVEVPAFRGPPLRFSAAPLREMADLLDRQGQTIQVHQLGVGRPAAKTPVPGPVWKGSLG
jgi:tRNA A-37 threonylcarbamoyl transferase component Bud32